MNVSGFSAFVATDSEQLTPCPICGTDARITGGSCLGCLLQTGLVDEPETETGSLDEILSEIEIRDTDWQIGNYRILEEIGRGGMGVIYRARQRHSKRIVALKRVLSYHGDSRETLERFRREAEAAASLDHPNILPIYDVGEADGLPFFTMKYATGGTLLQMAPLLRADPRECVRLMTKITHAVAYAHRHGILHRDLKPGNILLDARTEPMVSDFGLAKWIDASSNLTRSLAIFGTPGFIAPEQATGEQAKLTPAADIYSLGAILFDFLAGRPPFLGEHAISVIRQASEKAAPKLRTIDPSIDRDLETICAKCLEREPKARYQAAADLAEDFERWLEGRPIKARPVSPVTHSWRWAKRNKVQAASLTGCALLAAAVMLRQYQTNQLENAIKSDAAAAHSIAVLPFLDLDQILPDTGLSSQVAASLQQAIAKQGPSRVDLVGAPSKRWTGTLSSDEIVEAARKARSRTVLTGTRRYVDGKMRVSLHLMRENGTDVLGHWLIEANAAEPIWSLQEVPDLAGLIYKLLDQKTDSAPAVDPVMSNERARKFLVAGRDLIARRTVAEMDRAISCLENAVKEEPRSVYARSVLTSAYVGRYLLSAQPELMQRATKVAEETVAFAPKDPAAHRALCFVYANNGLYREALEQGFQSIELGDRSERASGNIAACWRSIGRPDRAVAWYQKAKLSQRQPADYDALLGDCWTDLLLDEQAQREYESASAFHPDQPDGWMGLCRLKLLAGDVEGARKDYQTQLPHYAGFPPAKQLAAMVEFFSRNFDEARRLYSELASNDPLGGGHADVYGAINYRSAIGRLELEAGRTSQGESLLREAVASEEAGLIAAPQDATAYYRLAAAQAALGEIDSCLQSLRGAIDNGWIDYRSMRLDPRFDRVSGTTQFQNMISELATRAGQLGQTLPVSSTALSEEQPTKK